jgi:hypothetical protein
MKRNLLIATVALVPLLAHAQSAWVAPESMKIRPSDTPGTTRAVTLEAARNEFEAFHLVLDGGSAGMKGATVTASDLKGPDNQTIGGGDLRIYREGWYDVSTPSSVMGSTGRWPDAMIPAVDEVANEPRNAFPVDVPAGEQQPIYVEYHVPSNVTPGVYTGNVHVAGSFTADIPVTLAVHGFALPSTSSLRTAFGMGWSDACVAHFGSYQACGGDAGTIQLMLMYTRFALDHRISIDSTVYFGPAASGSGYDWESWDKNYAPVLDGTASTRLAGAKLTSVRYEWTQDTPHYQEWATHFRQHGWFDRTFDYTCDEPPATCAWSDIVSRAAVAHAGDPEFRTLTTTNIDSANANGVASSLNILVPIINELAPIGAPTTRSAYASWLTGADRELWSYESCQSDGCNIVGQERGWPSYMIDSPALTNRAMEWQSWRNQVKGELYYMTTYAFGRGDAWTNQYYFGGNGDGTLFYPGTPAKIGGKTDVPLASLRMKLIRAGLEDYEYLKQLADSGDPTMADTEAAQLAPTSTTFTSDPAALDAARHRIAARLDALQGYAIPNMPAGTSNGAPPPSSSSSGSSDTSGGGEVGSGGGSPGSPSAPPKAGGCSAAGDHPGATGLLISGVLALLLVIRRSRVRR